MGATKPSDGSSSTFPRTTIHAALSKRGFDEQTRALERMAVHQDE
jgi:hypothetical protein